MRNLLIAVAFIAGSLFVQGTSEASVTDSLGLNNASSKVGSLLSKSDKKALRHNKKSGALAPAPVSPCTTILAQVLCAQEDLFTLVHDAFAGNLISRHATRRFVRRTVRSDFKVVGHSGRSEFKTYNNGANQKSVRSDYFSYIFNGGVLPVYF